MKMLLIPLQTLVVIVFALMAIVWFTNRRHLR
jgi:hypothetical protein